MSLSLQATRLLATLGACCLVLTACGGSEDTVAAPASASASATPSAPPVCPTKAPVEVDPPAGSTTDLSAKPVVAPASAPAPTELQYADIVVGDGAEAVTGSQVEVKYVGALYESGTEFDSSWSRGVDKTIPFGICRAGVIPGFAVGPTGMKVGGRRVITIPSELGYKEAGQPPVIPGGATLVFVVDLVRVG
ncbi:MAG: FKBP-type peptidyl-prolyl cis-trans isomerase [Mycobacteriales bacterium]